MIRVRTTQPDGTATQTEFPAPGTADTALICFRLGSGGSSSLIQAEIILAKAKGTDWKLTPEVLRLGLDVAGAGIEIIPPQ